MELIKIEKDVEKARSLHKLAKLRYGKIGSFDIEKESSLIAEAYYEVCKEIITAIMYADGYKTLSHKDLIEYIKTNYAVLNSDEIEILDNLRKRRNKLVYYGIFQPSFYVKKNKEIFEEIISKIESLLKERI